VTHTKKKEISIFMFFDMEQKKKDSDVNGNVRSPKVNCY